MRLLHLCIAKGAEGDAQVSQVDTGKAVRVGRTRSSHTHQDLHHSYIKPGLTSFFVGGGPGQNLYYGPSRGAGCFSWGLQGPPAWLSMVMLPPALTCRPAHDRCAGTLPLHKAPGGPWPTPCCTSPWRAEATT
jgi:hypothetical protein